MNQTQALAKARKLLGPKAEIHVRKSVPVGEDRLAEIERRSKLSVDLKALQDARDARRNEVLRGDAEFQRLKTEAARVEKERDSLHASYHRRVTIVVNKGWCNHHEAEGDNLEEAIAALEAKKAVSA